MPVYEKPKKNKKGDQSSRVGLEEENKDMSLMQTMLIKDFDKLIRGDITSKMVIQ